MFTVYYLFVKACTSANKSDSLLGIAHGKITARQF